ncbi:hypothetical protein TUBRATIS_18970 [Tubulinosema ratisbonensis]|uniref:Uncharacterized protein n=1 Tax=Tubulinosema ratisbonensis TaxID=291195 RepID=A0A437AKQ0_9MICR|nr:hypothetical protein TUBRATIS_18970 [Tubulinosema ratisbonensis]
MNIEDILVKLIKKEELPKDLSYEKEPYLHYEELDDIPTHKLTCFLYNFIDYFITNSTQHLKNFIKEVEDYKLIKKEFLQIKSVYQTNFSRELKIYLFKLKKSFLEKNIDFKDRNYILNLINYFYLESLEFLRYERIEFKEEEKKPISVIQIDCKGKKKDLFFDRNKPTLSLDDYANKVMSAMKERENKFEKEVRKEVSLEDLRKEDEFKDDLIKNKRNMG